MESMKVGIEAEREQARTWPWVDGLLLAVSFGVLAYGCAQWQALWADDAFITFRYAKHVADGVGPIFNVGERVEGFSSPLSVFVLAAGMKLGFDPPWLARILGIASAGLLVFAVYWSLRVVGVVGWGAALATFVVSSSPVVHFWTMAGMETLPYSLLLFVGLALLTRPEAGTRTIVGASGALALAALTRPEGLAFWVGGLALSVIRMGRFGARPIAYFAAPGLSIVAYGIWRMSYFGLPLPNTYYAKVGTDFALLWSHGLRELGVFFDLLCNQASVAVAIAGVAMGLASRRGQTVLVMAPATLFYFVYVVSVGGDSLGVLRYHVPVFALLAFMGGLLFVDAGPHLRGRQRKMIQAVGALGVCLTVYGAHALMNGERRPKIDVKYLEGNVKLGRHLRQNFPEDSLIAVSAAGAIPFYSDRPTLDLYGLNDAHIARQPVRGRNAYPGHMKWDIDYVMSRKPDLIVVNRGYFRSGEVEVGEILARPLMLISSPMEEELFSQVRWNPDYLFRAIDLGDGSSFFVFERKKSAAR